MRARDFGVRRSYKQEENDVIAGNHSTHPGDKRYARRNAEGQFTENQVDVGKSLAADRRSKAKKIVPKGQGDRGDQKTAPAKGR